MAEKKIINIGIIGVGCISDNHLLSLSIIENKARLIWKWKVSDMKFKPVLYAFADIDGVALQAKADAFNINVRYSGPTAGMDLINDENVHAVYVLTPTVDHLKFVLAAAKKKKHVFCEKPLAFSPNDVQKMINVRDKYDVVIQPGLVFRSAPQINYLKKIYEENQEKWGKLTNIIFRDTQEKPYSGLDSHKSTWRKDKSKAYAGNLFEHIIHDIDGMISVFGEVDQVFSNIKYIAGIEGIEDSVSAIIQFKNKITLSANGMWNDITFSERRYELFFEKAWLMLTVDEAQDKAVVVTYKYLDEEIKILSDEMMDEYFRKEILKLPHIAPEVSGPYYYESVRFLNAIKNCVPSDVTLEVGKYVQEVIEACYKSSKKNIPIKNIGNFIR